MIVINGDPSKKIYIFIDKPHEDKVKMFANLKSLFQMWWIENINKNMTKYGYYKQTPFSA
jgi:hypothetical protein